MQCKLIVTDMDGTLLNSQDEISKRTYDALIKAQEKGIKVILASGRSWVTMKDFGEQLQIPRFDGYYVGANGSAIMEAKTMENTIVSQLQPDEIKEIFEIAKEYEVEIMCVLDAGIYDYIPASFRELKRQYRKEHNIADDVPWTGGTFLLVEDQRVGYPDIHDVQSFDEIDFPVNKMTLCQTTEVIEKAYQGLSEKFKGKYVFAKTSDTWIEVTSQSVSKGNAVSLLQEKFDIKKEETLVFGDGENDLSMFERGYAVAMGNAMNTVKAKANEVTLDNNSNGIAVIVERFL